MNCESCGDSEDDVDQLYDCEICGRTLCARCFGSTANTVCSYCYRTERRKIRERRAEYDRDDIRAANE